MKISTADHLVYVAVSLKRYRRHRNILQMVQKIIMRDLTDRCGSADFSSLVNIIDGHGQNRV